MRLFKGKAPRSVWSSWVKARCVHNDKDTNAIGSPLYIPDPDSTTEQNQLLAAQFDVSSAGKYECVVYVGRIEDDAVPVGYVMLCSDRYAYCKASMLSEIVGGQLPECAQTHIRCVLDDGTQFRLGVECMFVPRQWTPANPYMHDHCFVKLMVNDQTAGTLAYERFKRVKVIPDLGMFDFGCSDPLVLDVIRRIASETREHKQRVTERMSRMSSQRNPQLKPDVSRAKLNMNLRDLNAYVRNTRDDDGSDNESCVSGVTSCASSSSSSSCSSKHSGKSKRCRCRCNNKCGCPQGAARCEGKPWALPADYDPIIAARVTAQTGACSSGNPQGCIQGGKTIRLIPPGNLKYPQASQYNSSGQYIYETKRRMMGLPVGTVLGMKQPNRPDSDGCDALCPLPRDFRRKRRVDCPEQPLTPDDPTQCVRYEDCIFV